MNHQELIEMCKKHAASHNEVLNPNAERLDWVLKGLLTNEKKRGKIYCPCRIIPTDKKEARDYICPCIFHTKEVETQGHCLCQLFFKK